MDTKKQAIGFIGLGTMGSRLAGRLIDSGYNLTVWNRTADKAKPLAKRGAKVAKTVAELAACCDCILSMLSDDAAVEEVYYGPAGVVGAAHVGSTVIEMSTVAPHTARTLHEALAARGMHCLDVGLSGSTEQAEQGSLVAFAGGEQKLFEQVRPILKVFGKEIMYMGGPTSGKMMKLVVNVILGVEMQALAEAIALGEKSGLDRAKLLDALERTAILSPGHKSKIENAKREQYPVAFALRLMAKDFNLIFRQAVNLAVPMPATAAAQQAVLAEQARGVEEDFSSVILREEQLAGINPIPPA